ncbi:hypothetical protein ACHAWX_000404 [Stephanocyclus meneghinianus]
MQFNVIELIQNDMVWIIERFDIGQWTVVDYLALSSSGSDTDSTLWYPFLYGELTFSVLIPFGVHGLLASTRRCDEVKSSVSTYMLLAVVLGLFLAHQCMGDTVKREQEQGVVRDFENTFERMVGQNKLIVMALLSFVLSYILVLGDVSSKLSPTPPRSNATISTQKRITYDDGIVVYYTYQAVRCIVKSSGVLNISVASMVLYMGAYSNGPMDLIPNLKWHEYDLEATFGTGTAYSSQFFYVIECTMLATIMQTMVIGLTTTFSPLWSNAMREALDYSMVGVPLIIMANAITLAIYMSEDFKAGTECMVAHIHLLATSNFYIPFVWWTQRVWVNSNYNPFWHDNVVPTSEQPSAANGCKEKEE